MLTTGIARHRLLHELGYGSRRGICLITAKRNTPHWSRLGSERRVVGRTLAWPHGYRRLRIRYERRGDIHRAFLAFACSPICHRCPKPFCWAL